MSKRLQVVLPDDEMETIRRQAKSESLSVGEYVRRALREVASRQPTRSSASKLRSIREAVGYSFPTADIKEMNREIEQGYQD